MPVPIIQLVGPTASGKSGLAIELALVLASRGQPAQIVNADSMLVYRGMDIGTAKPSLAERCGVPHHLVDILDVTETASVAEYQGLARRTLAGLRAEGITPILVGGSALYSRAITDVFEFPGTDPELRQRWERELERRGPESLHAELSLRAPDQAGDILPGNGRRIVRALELLDLGHDLRPTLPTWTYAMDGVVTIGLQLERELMDERIDQRVDQMWKAGLVDEVAGLLQVGLRQGRTASRAIGYRQVIDVIDGRCTQDQARDDIARATRRFARKQLGWYRRDQRIHWVPALTTTAGQVADLVGLAPSG